MNARAPVATLLTFAFVQPNPESFSNTSQDSLLIILSACSGDFNVIFKGTRHDSFAEQQSTRTPEHQSIATNISPLCTASALPPKISPEYQLLQLLISLLTRPNSKTPAGNFDPIHLNSLFHAPASHALSIYPSYRTPSAPSYWIPIACSRNSWVKCAPSCPFRSPILLRRAAQGKT